MQVTVNGSKPHYIRNVHVSPLSDGRCLATGLVSGKPVHLVYDGNEMTCVELDDTRQGKPWLRQVRKDLVSKYIADYGDVPGHRGPRREVTDGLLRVDDDFLALLKAKGFNVEKSTVYFSDIHRVNIAGMGQLHALELIKAKRNQFNADVAKEREAVNRMIDELIA